GDEGGRGEDCVSDGGGRGPDRRCILDRTEREDAGEGCALDVERSRHRAGGDQELPIAVAPAVPRDHLMGLCVERSDRGFGHELDVVLVIEPRRLDENLVTFRLAAEKALGERRTVVGEGALLRQEGYPSAASGGSVLLDRTSGGKPSTDDAELEPAHVCFVRAGREFLPVRTGATRSLRTRADRAGSPERNAGDHVVAL